MKRPAKIVIALGALAALAGCVSMPTGPSVMALPGTGKSFDQFRADDYECRQYASSQVGSPDDAAANSGLKSAAIGTAVGAVAGAAIGGRSGAATGAGVGLLGGSLAGTSAAGASQYGVQRRYDNGYLQCMYAKGHRIPTYGGYGYSSRPATHYTSPPPPPPANAPAPSSSANIPPPPAGTPPPPPPGAR